MKLYLACLLLLTIHFPDFAQNAQTGRLKPIYVKGKWGYANDAGRVVIPPRFDAARQFSDGLAQVALLDEELPETRSGPNLKWGYIDEHGRVRVELRYAILRHFSEGLAAAALLDREEPERLTPGRGGDHLNLKWGYVDTSGREVIPLQFLTAGDFAEGLAPVNPGGDGSKGEGSWCGPPANYGYIDRTGAFVIQPQFTHASKFQNGRAHVSIGRVTYVGRCMCCAPRFIGKYGYVDKSGAFVADKSKGSEATLEEDWEN